ncbi:hypothetical protein EJB05_03944, partial [Eragrostis curvula]
MGAEPRTCGSREIRSGRRTRHAASSVWMSTPAALDRESREIVARISEQERWDDDGFRPSRTGGSATRRVISPSPDADQGLAVSLRRLAHSGSQGEQRPPKSPEEKVTALIDEILATRSFPQNVMEKLYHSSMEARREINKNEHSKYNKTFMVLISGSLIGYRISKNVY